MLFDCWSPLYNNWYDILTKIDEDIAELKGRLFEMVYSSECEKNLWSSFYKVT